MAHDNIQTSELQVIDKVNSSICRLKPHNSLSVRTVTSEGLQMLREHKLRAERKCGTTLWRKATVSAVGNRTQHRRFQPERECEPNAALKQPHSDSFYHWVSWLFSPFTVVKHRKTHISFKSYNIRTYGHWTDKLFLRLKRCIFPALLHK